MGARAKVATATIVGVQAVPVDVEIDIGPGIPSFAIVGLGDTAVQEARERVRSALRASGFDVPNARIVVNLAPAPLRKHGTGFDLPIALGILVATKQVDPHLVESTLVAGELSLDGGVRGVPGELAFALSSAARGLQLLAPAMAVGALQIEGLDHRPLRRLVELRQGMPEGASLSGTASPVTADIDFAEVVGQSFAVRALTVAAAGGHSLLMVGPPGSGKTMLARRLPTILPPLSDEERMETALVHSVAGLDTSPALGGVRPFRAPHHSTSIAGLIGGGSPPRPGEASLAHNGVLFLDEMPEFGPAALQCLRQPLEDGSVTVVRAEGRATYPAHFALVGSANPCSCGYLGDPVRSCTCPPSTVERYRLRIGGPLMDRIDMVVEVQRPDPGLLLETSSQQDSRSLRVAVIGARCRALARDGVMPSLLSGSRLVSACLLDAASRELLERSARNHHLSGRGVTRLLRVARTLADLDDLPRVESGHIAEALGYRVTGRQ